MRLSPDLMDDTGVFGGGGGGVGDARMSPSCHRSFRGLRTPPARMLARSPSGELTPHPDGWSKWHPVMKRRGTLSHDHCGWSLTMLGRRRHHQCLDPGPRRALDRPGGRLRESPDGSFSHTLCSHDSSSDVSDLIE